MKSFSSAELLAGPPLREFILLAGKDSVGKSSAIVSLAWYIEQTQPDAKFYVIDTENKFVSALKSFGTDAPRNILYYKCDDMNAITDAIDEVMSKHQRGDWCAVESMARVWDRAQDLAYRATSGVSKVEYLEKRPKSGKGSGPIPSPDDFWKIAKGAHDGAFLDLLSGSTTLNVILSTTVLKPKADGFMKENADRKAARVELGMDVGMGGAPALPYQPETLCLLERVQGKVTCRVLRDNLSVLDDSRIDFDVENRKVWAANFWSQCR